MVVIVEMDRAVCVIMKRKSCELVREEQLAEQNTTIIHYKEDSQLPVIIPLQSVNTTE